MFIRVKFSIRYFIYLLVSRNFSSHGLMTVKSLVFSWNPSSTNREQSISVSSGRGVASAGGMLRSSEMNTNSVITIVFRLFDAQSPKQHHGSKSVGGMTKIFCLPFHMNIWIGCGFANRCEPGRNCYNDIRSLFHLWLKPDNYARI